MVIFSSNGPRHAAKDTMTNCEETGEFVVNIATWDLREDVNRTSKPLAPEADEMELAGLEAAPSRLVKPPRVKASPIHLECVYHQTVELPCNDIERRSTVILGRIVSVHIRDDVLTDGLVDMSKFRPIARLGYIDYTRVDTAFTMRRPK